MSVVLGIASSAFSDRVALAGFALGSFGENSAQQSAEIKMENNIEWSPFQKRVLRAIGKDETNGCLALGPSRCGLSTVAAHWFYSQIVKPDGKPRDGVIVARDWRQVGFMQRLLTEIIQKDTIASDAVRYEDVRAGLIRVLPLVNGSNVFFCPESLGYMSGYQMSAAWFDGVIHDCGTIQEWSMNLVDMKGKLLWTATEDRCENDVTDSFRMASERYAGEEYPQMITCRWRHGEGLDVSGQLPKR